MSFTTVTVNDPGIITMSASPWSLGTTTVTCRLSTTLRATEGQTLTITSPAASPLRPTLYPTGDTTLYTPVVTVATSTVTLTELDVYLQDPDNNIYSTRFISLTPEPPPQASATQPPTHLVFVVESREEGWDSWSKGEKAGLIVGVVLGTFLILGFLWCCLKRWNIWFAHGWWPTMPPQPPRHPVNYSATMIQPGHTAAAVVPYAAGYPQAYHNQAR